MAEIADDDSSFYCSQFVHSEDRRNAQTCQGEFRVVGRNGIIGGRKHSAHNTRNRYEHNVVAELPLGHDYCGAKRRTGQIGKWKPRQNYATTRER